MTEHVWVDDEGIRWKAADYGVFVYMDGDKWTTPLESDSVATVEMNRLAREYAKLLDELRDFRFFIDEHSRLENDHCPKAYNCPELVRLLGISDE